MTAEIIDGLKIRKEILEELKKEVEQYKAKYNSVPGLSTILVGNNPASLSYVSLKIKTARELGFYEVQENLPEDIKEEELLSVIDKYNKDEKIHGILVQLPLPKHISEERIVNAIDYKKDVDGIHPINFGKLLADSDDFFFSPCTPLGIKELILRSKVKTKGAEVVVVGRSNIVGKPIAAIMSQKGVDSTVTLVHSKTENMASHIKRADILIVAAGVPHLIKPEQIKKGATVIDVGVNRIGINKETGKAILKGDVDFEEAKKIAGKITPVPGGVGPMTIIMLMRNTINSAKNHIKAK